jgi:hypothetical protein
MNISIACKISLSKKLRALLNGRGTLVLTTGDLADGKGIAKLSLSSEIEGEQYNLSLLDGETSIMIKPTGLVYDEMPDGQTVGSIFSTIPKKGEAEEMVHRIAVVHAPEEKEEIAHAVVPKNKIVTPPEFSALDNKDCKEYVSNLEGLIDAVNKAKHKVSDIDLNSITNVRERAVMTEVKEKAEAIEVSAYIVSDQCAKLAINDLDISLDMNMPFDLSNISARRIAASADLKALLSNGLVKFIAPSERESYVRKAVRDEAQKSRGLEVYDNHKAAEHAIATEITEIDEDAAIEISEADEDVPTEEESLINLTSIPVNRTAGTTTTHGSRPTSGKTPSISAIRRK